MIISEQKKQNNQLQLRAIYSILLLIHQDKKRRNLLINPKRKAAKRNEIIVEKTQNQSEISKSSTLNTLPKRRIQNQTQVSLILFVAKMLKKHKENENSQYNQLQRKRNQNLKRNIKKSLQTKEQYKWFKLPLNITKLLLLQTW